MSTIGRWLKEPLVHFVVLGAAVFALHRWVAPPGQANRIVLSDSVIRGLRQEHLRRNGALPTAEEETALIRRFIDNEILYREALALGLDRGDIIVRRRLVQKMEFLAEEREPIAEASDTDLQAYLDAHAERYAVAARVSMTHVFASSDRHGNQLETVATHLRQQLLSGVEPSAIGDPFLRGRDFVLQTERELAGTFGTRFAAQVMSLPAGEWSAPLRSSYGLHLVRVAQRQAARHPQLADVRDAVRRDWQEERRADAKRAALERLRQRYAVEIEGSRPGAAHAAVAP